MMILGLYIEKGYETALVDCSTGEILSRDRDEIVRILDRKSVVQGKSVD